MIIEFKDDDKTVVFDVPLKIRKGEMTGYEYDLSKEETIDLFTDVKHNEYVFDIEKNRAYILLKIAKEKETEFFEKAKNKIKIKDDSKISADVLLKVKAKEAHFEKLKETHIKAEAFINGLEK